MDRPFADPMSGVVGEALITSGTRAWCPAETGNPRRQGRAGCDFEVLARQSRRARVKLMLLYQELIIPDLFRNRTG